MIDAHAAVQRVSDPYEVTHGTASFTKIYNDDKVMTSHERPSHRGLSVTAIESANP